MLLHPHVTQSPRHLTRSDSGGQRAEGPDGTPNEYISYERSLSHMLGMCCLVGWLVSRCACASRSCCCAAQSWLPTRPQPDRQTGTCTRARSIEPQSVHAWVTRSSRSRTGLPQCCPVERTGNYRTTASEPPPISPWPTSEARRVVDITAGAVPQDRRRVPRSLHLVR
jgi:hypothetical protein